jgi:hypothetical protein
MIHPTAVLLLLFSSIAVGVTGQCDDRYAECSSRRVFDIADLDEYYSSANSLSGEFLKAELNLIIRDHYRYNYKCACVGGVFREQSCNRKPLAATSNMYS